MEPFDIVMTVTNPSTWGIDPRVMKEAKALVDLGFRVMVIGWDRENRYKRTEVVDNIRVERINVKSKYGNIFSLLLKLPIFYLKVVKKIFKMNFKAIHTHDFDTAIIGLFFKFILGKRWVYDAHDLYFTFFSMNRSGKNKILAHIIKKTDILFAKLCDTLIVATQRIDGRNKGLKEYYINAGIDERKISTIWNVPDVNDFLNYQKINLQKSKKYTIGFIGPQRTVENFEQLFRALDDNPQEYKVILVGKGTATEELKQIVKHKYRALEVEFIDFVDYQLIPNYYEVCDVIFAYYPMRENIKRAIPIKVFESSILGIPLIVNANTLAEDFIRRYNCGIAIDALKKPKLKDALEKVKKIKFNPEIIRKNWNWNNERNKLAQIYKTLIS